MQKGWLMPVLLAAWLAVISVVFFWLFLPEQEKPITVPIPAYCGEPYVVIGDNRPNFSEYKKQSGSYEFYSDLDAYNRCGYAEACIGPEMLPKEERGSIGQVKPSGWQTIKYDFVDGKYLYNRCHLIGYQLSGENANPKNLITGTRYLNMEGMLPFENMVADYIKASGNHVLYRVTPDFQHSELVARGVRIEGWSVEDHGAGICFCIYSYNVQPGVLIDYSTGASKLDEIDVEIVQQEVIYLVNISSKRFHLESCRQAKEIKEENREIYYGSRDGLLDRGYLPAGCCDP